MGTTEHEEPRFFFILNKGAKSGGEITHAVLNGSIWKIQCKLPPKTKRFCPLVLK